MIKVYFTGPDESKLFISNSLNFLALGSQFAKFSNCTPSLYIVSKYKLISMYLNIFRTILTAIGNSMLWFLRVGRCNCNWSPGPKHLCLRIVFRKPPTVQSPWLQSTYRKRPKNKTHFTSLLSRAKRVLTAHCDCTHLTLASCSECCVHGRTAPTSWFRVTAALSSRISRQACATCPVPGSRCVSEGVHWISCTIYQDIEREKCSALCHRPSEDIM